ncbi:MAG: UDP-N-acetylmuramoyl-L-alanine--D-glutamate ligase [Candidatus Falkowbacteria bacterium]|nr:MAG: UDP-N-acetylmuramoyl-L-alanine--D-glutamate ligase [Candidatus Falkowbacteria bacterium]
MKNVEQKTKIALLGLGMDNLALLKLLDENRAPADITICDFRNPEQLPKVKLKNLKVNYRLGAEFNKNLSDFSLLFRAPGWPIACPGIQAALKTGKTKLSSPLNLFLELVPTKNIIGVTGTKGKGTTATLIYKILQAANQKTGRRIFLGGNIGITPLSFLKKVRPQDYVVLELSSFQLEDIKTSPRIAVITNLFKEHLAPADPNNPNFHSSLKKYWEAKLNITRYSENKYLVVNESLKSQIKNEQLPGKIIYFNDSNLNSGLVGDYNRQNIAAAIEVSKILKIKAEIYQAAIAKFKNLEHRLEFVTKIKGVKYFDNSFSTTPESTALDLLSFKEPIVQIAGGADKGADFKPLAKVIKQKTDFLILLPGKGSDRMAAELKKINFPDDRLALAEDMKEAVSLARLQAGPDSVILLSTACASFGIFKNYKERGDLFQKYAKQK